MEAKLKETVEEDVDSQVLTQCTSMEEKCLGGGNGTPLDFGGRLAELLTGPPEAEIGDNRCASPKRRRVVARGPDRSLLHLLLCSHAVRDGIILGIKERRPML